jgi:hypothetical protein
VVVHAHHYLHQTCSAACVATISVTHDALPVEDTQTFALRYGLISWTLHATIFHS